MADTDGVKNAYTVWMGMGLALLQKNLILCHFGRPCSVNYVKGKMTLYEGDSSNLVRRDAEQDDKKQGERGSVCKVLLKVGGYVGSQDDADSQSLIVLTKEQGKKDSKAVGKELPSFFPSIPQKPKEPNTRDIRKPSVDFKGTIFFGGTNQCHPKPHSVALTSHFTHISEIQTKENIWDNLFQDVSPVIKTYPGRKKFRLVRKKLGFVDVWPHRAPGVRVAAGHGIRKFVPNLGISTSVIKGETILEILDQIPVDPSKRSCERELQRVRKRHVLEKWRKILPPEKRAAHFHFPKAFADVTVFGPPIPASLTVIQLKVAEEEEDEKLREVVAEEEEEESNFDEENSLDVSEGVEESGEEVTYCEFSN